MNLGNNVAKQFPKENKKPSVQAFRSAGISGGGGKGGNDFIQKYFKLGAIDAYKKVFLLNSGKTLLQSS